MLSGILSAEEVDVLCIQEVLTGDFPRLPVNQPYSYDGPSESRRREAGFLVHNGVSSAEVPGVLQFVANLRRSCVRLLILRTSCGYY